MEKPEEGFRKTLYKYSLEQKQTDFIIRAGDQAVHCHKLVLCAESPYFDSLCASGVFEAIIKLPTSNSSENGKVLHQLVRYIYLETVELTKYTVELVLQAAMVIECDKLKAECERFMISVLDLKNTKKYSELAEKFYLTKLNVACQNFQRQNFTQLLHTEWFLAGLSVDEFVNYLKDDNLRITSEDEVLEAVITWLDKCDASDTKKEQYIDKLFPHVRLSFCNQLRLKSMAPNKQVPVSLKSKVYDYLYGKQQMKYKPRASYSASQQQESAQKTHSKESNLHQTNQEQHSERRASRPASQHQRCSKRIASSVVKQKKKPLGYGKLTTSQQQAHMEGKGSRSTSQQAVFIIPVTLQKSQTAETTSGKMHQKPTKKSRIYPQSASSKRSGGKRKNTEDSLAVISKDGGIMWQESGEWKRDVAHAALLQTHWYPSICAHGDKIIVSGGYSRFLQQSVANVHLFCVTTSKWSELVDLQIPREGHGSAIIDEKLYILAGHRWKEGVTNMYTDCHVLDLKSNSWSTIEDIPLPLCYPSVAVVDGDIIVTAGKDSSLSLSQKTMKYQPHKDLWTPCKDMPVSNELALNSTVAVDSCVYVLVAEDFCMYNVKLDSWSLLSAPTVLSYKCSLVLCDNRLVALGGEDNNGTTLDQMQSYDFQSQKWSIEDTKMPTRMSSHFTFAIQRSKNKE